MARKRKASKRTSLFSRSKSRKSKSSGGLLSGLKSAVSGRTGAKRRAKPSIKSLATELARIKLKAKIQKEKLKVMRV